jgi:amino acid transporter
MITAALSAAVVAVLSAFGIKVGAAGLAAIVVTAKICVVAVIGLIGWRTAKARKKQVAADAQAVPPAAGSAGREERPDGT